jgi:acyl-CoA synthetase (AMP-forming)/AMP-acid ligase II
MFIHLPPPGVLKGDPGNISVKDIIIRGENIHSTTVENGLHEHPEIIDVAAVGVLDNRLGELVATVDCCARQQAD